MVAGLGSDKRCSLRCRVGERIRCATSCPDDQYPREGTVLARPAGHPVTAAQLLEVERLLALFRRIAAARSSAAGL